MAEIRLENVTKIFKPSRFKLFSSGGVRRSMGDYQDRAFVDRVAGHEVASPLTDGPVHALDNLTLTIRNGETMAVVGPSGCGKSTLLRIVAGLEEPDEGRIYYDDQDMTDVKPRERGIGMVFQSYALYPHMKGEGNLAFFFKVRKRPPEEMMERIHITADIMGIGFEQLLGRKPGTLSGGQQQRVAIGRCIVRDPTLFLFDEPLSSLDAKLRTSTRIEIKRLLHRFHITAIYVTHDQTEAITLGERIAVMRDGKIEQLGTYREIVENPANAFVAGFLGLPPMNQLKGWTVNDDGTMAGDFGRIDLPAQIASQVGAGQSVTLGFRSGSAQVVTEKSEPSPDSFVIEGKVLNCEPNFARHYQLVNVETAGVIYGVQAPLELRINMRWPVQVIVPAESAYFFDEGTESRIVRN